MKKACVFAALFICAIFLRAEESEEPESFRRKNRMIELGLNADLGFANNYLSGPEIFQETLVLDLDKLEDGLEVHLGGTVSPLYFNFNRNDNWGFGIFVNAEVLGNADISGNMLTLSEAENDKFGVGAAVFAEAGLHGFFHIKKFRIKIRPAGFYPLIYTEPDMSYTFKNGTDSTGVLKADFTYNMLIYTASSLESSGQLTAQPGVDLGAGVDYPLFSFLDLGMDVIHIPLVPAVMRDYMSIKGSTGIETDNIFDADLENLLSTKTDTKYGSGEKYVIRPFKTRLYADYRPFKTRLFALVPSAGFAYSPLYVQNFFPEGGLGLRLDLANIFIATLGVNYEDRLWKNSIDLALNLRAFGLDLGVAMQSQDFIKSWQLNGLAASLGLKFGW
jgi:hypothetical protein